MKSAILLQFIDRVAEVRTNYTEQARKFLDTILVSGDRQRARRFYQDTSRFAYWTDEDFQRVETDEERARRQEREAAANERSAQAERISAVRATTDQQLTAETSVRGTIAAVKLVTSHLPREAHYAFSMLITELQSSPVYPSTIFLREYGGMLQEKADTIPEVQALLVVLSERYGVDFSTES